MPYSYSSFNPSNVGRYGRDRMRFELGDTVVDGHSAFLSDAEYDAILQQYPNSWKRAKLAIIESIMRRLSYEVDESVGPASWSLRQRYENWRGMYDQLKAELSACSVPSAHPAAISGDRYFYEGIHNNPLYGGTEKKWDGGE